MESPVKITLYWRVIAAGVILFILRLIQNRTGFDAVTGLAQPTIVGTVLPVCLILVAIIEIAVNWKLSKSSPGFASHFSPPEKWLPLSVTGSGLFMAGGLLQTADAITRQTGIRAVATGLLACLSGISFLIFIRQQRQGTTIHSIMTLPGMAFGVLLVLNTYLNVTTDPVLPRYYITVLAATAAAASFSQLAAFFRKEGSPRRFTLIGNLAVILCLTAMADGTIGEALTYGGIALTLLSFLLHQKPEGLRGIQTANA